MNRGWLRHKKDGHINLRKNLGKKPKVTKEDFEIYRLKIWCILRKAELRWRCAKIEAGVVNNQAINYLLGAA